MKDIPDWKRVENIDAVGCLTNRLIRAPRKDEHERHREYGHRRRRIKFCATPGVFQPLIKLSTCNVEVANKTVGPCQVRIQPEGMIEVFVGSFPVEVINEIGQASVSISGWHVMEMF